MKPVFPAETGVWRDEAVLADTRILPEETPVAIVHDGSTTAVMMATPADLADFGIGFSLSEGVIDAISEIRSLEVVPGEQGIEVRLWLKAEASNRVATRRRAVLGPTGCGLCGIDSLAAAMKSSPSLAHLTARTSPRRILEAMTQLETAQIMGRQTRAVHAAALVDGDAPLLVREDVGRHNALDKLIGAAVAAGRRSIDGMVLLTSRVSIEMVQKAAVLGAPIVCAISVPTALAVRTAEAAGITLVGIARRDGFEVFTRPDRIDGLG